MTGYGGLLKTRALGIVAASIVATIFLSGCTQESDWGKPDPNDTSSWKDVTEPPKASLWEAKVTESSAATASDFVTIASCNQAVKVIGIGDPGHGNKVEQHLYYAADLLGAQEVGRNPSQRPTVSYEPIEIQYDDKTLVFKSFSDVDADGYNKFRYAADKAAGSIVSKIVELEKSCPGTKFVLRGHGLGAYAVREAVTRAEDYELSNISAVWLSADPTRLAGEKIAVVPGGPDLGFLGRSKVTENDPTVGGKLAGDGMISSISDPFDERIRDRVITTCYSNDPFCNLGDQSLETFYSKNGGEEAALRTHSYEYVGMPTTEPAAKWVEKLVMKDVADGKANTSNPNMKPEVAGYINYLNTYTNSNGEKRRYPGAKVLQESIEPAAVAEQCSDYTIVGARGSGEQISGNRQDSEGNRTENSEGYTGGRPAGSPTPVISGFSEFLATYAWEIKRQLPSDKTIRFVPAIYQAVSLEDSLFTVIPDVMNGEPPAVLPVKLVNGIDLFIGSSEDGRMRVNETISNLNKVCPDTKIVLMGYSQGAMAVHKSLLDINDEKTADSIAAALLISDPMRINSDPLPNIYMPRDHPNEFLPFKESDANSSLGSGIGASGHLGSITFSEKMKGKVTQICDLSDFVCNASLALLPGKVGFDTHTSAYRKGTHYEFPSEWAVGKLQGE